MCSVVGCDSARRCVPRFKLPEDPERRLEWVQFLFEVNGQRLKESSWTDITICNEHFKNDCFVKSFVPVPSHRDKYSKVRLALKPRAVPSLRPRSCLETVKCEETGETAGVVQVELYEVPASSEESSLTSMVAQENPVHRGSADTADVVTAHCGQMNPKNMNNGIIKEKAAVLQVKGKYAVNEKHLLRLLGCKCPSCGSKLRTEKVTCGALVVFNQQCLQCQYTNQWKSQVSASVPTAEDQHLTGGTEAPLTDDSHSSIPGVPEVVTVINAPDHVDQTSSDQGDLESDEDWTPATGVVIQRETEDETEEEEDEDSCGFSPLASSRHGQLCTECGKFFNKHRPHVCEHKIKPYCCNICGKRCVSEVALNCHSRVHDENYEHRCKYCHVAFRTKVDKHTHEQIHLFQGKPYKCPDCSERFATNKERRTHLEDHRGPPQLKCDICGIEFRSTAYLKRHLAVHTGVKPFKCSVCQRGFNQPSHLKSHMRLHTGERPYKCQHCDKCFNHNVSLKSHVQRYHTSNSGREQKRAKMNERKSDAEGNVGKRGADSGRDNLEEEQDTEEEEQNDRADIANSNKRSTGRPRGRPRRNSSGSLALLRKKRGQRSNAKARKAKAQRVKRTQSGGEENRKEALKNAARSGGRPKQTDSDSDVEPEERKDGSLKRRGRSSTNLVV